MKDTATLPKREIQIAELIAWGLSKKEIASKLFLSERTVENHTRSIYRKAGVTKSNELSAWWFCHKYSISLNESPIKQTVMVILLAVLSSFTLTTFQIF